MAIKKIYKVSFKGIILPGFDKEQVINNVHNITRIPEHTITRKFFSGKTVVIRHADSQEYASQLQKTFAQAGIETYIHEYTETITDDNVTDDKGSETQQSTSKTPSTSAPCLETFEQDSAFWNDDSPQEKDTGKTQRSKTAASLSKIIIAMILVVIIGAVILYFTVFTAPETKNTASVKPPETMAAQQKPVVKPETELSAFLETEKIQGLLKITSAEQLQQLSSIAGLLNLPPQFLQQVKSLIQKKNSILAISPQQPLYLFKTQQISGILVAAQKNISQPVSRQFSKLNTGNNRTDKSSSVPQFSVIYDNDYVLLSNIDNTQKLQLFKKLSDNKQLAENMARLDDLFAGNAALQTATFKLFYRDFLRLSADSESFYLQLDKNITSSYKDLLNTLDIVNRHSNKFSATKLSAVSELLQLIISQTTEISAITDQLYSLEFTPEQIIKIRKNYSAAELQTYQSKLDNELSPQWQSGPFALATSQFSYDKNLVIELAARGQNIQNLLEYSHSAYLQVDNVLNSENKNIMLPTCSAPHCNRAYFTDRNGAQEAYIDNDFISYQTITAHKAVNIKPGFNNQDVSEIQGRISLNLPKKIRIKTIKTSDSSYYLPLKQFSVFIRYQKNNTQLNYSVIGNSKHFLTLRAYNYSGDIIDTLSLTEQIQGDSKIRVFKRTFAEPVEEVKVFYSNAIKNISYPFAFKPAIEPDPQQLSTMAEDNPPVTADAQALDFPELDQALLLDVPSWLGKRWSDKASEHLPGAPFYLNLYLTARNDKTDAVINIKSGLSAVISQNITAVKLNLTADNTPVTEQFIAFSNNEYIIETINGPEIIPYLNANIAFEMNSSKKNIQGIISLSLPTRFNSHSEKYHAMGQRIETDAIALRIIQLDRHKITFRIEGEIKKLVQLKLYNKKGQLISEPFEFQHQESHKAVLSLLYHDQIDEIKVILSESATIRTYPFTFR